MFPYPTEWPQYFTATIHNWLPLLNADKYKDIIIDCLQFLTQQKRIGLNAFVFMNNHIHLIWQPLSGQTLTSIQLSFMKFTAQKIKLALMDKDSPILAYCLVDKKDRQYQIWKRNPLSIELHSETVFLQKLEYIHYNPVLSGLCKFPEDYYYSSALFYEKGIDDFNILTHYKG